MSVLFGSRISEAPTFSLPYLSQLRCELGADLSRRPRDQNPFHDYRGQLKPPSKLFVFPMFAHDRARIRVQMNAKITIEQLDSVIEAIERRGKKLEII